MARLYRERADAENVYDELKNQWGRAGYVTQKLAPCRLMANLIALLYPSAGSGSKRQLVAPLRAALRRRPSSGSHPLRQAQGLRHFDRLRAFGTSTGSGPSALRQAQGLRHQPARAAPRRRATHHAQRPAPIRLRSGHPHRQSEPAARKRRPDRGGQHRRQQHLASAKRHCGAMDHRAAMDAPAHPYLPPLAGRKMAGRTPTPRRPVPLRLNPGLSSKKHPENPPTLPPPPLSIHVFRLSRQRRPHSERAFVFERTSFLKLPALCRARVFGRLKSGTA